MLKKVKKIPNHIAIILDGNRRWAKAHGKPFYEGHALGKKNVMKIIKNCQKRGIKYISIWALSIDNLMKRSKEELDFLMRLYNEGFADILLDEDIYKDEVKVRVIGKWNFLPDFVKKSIKKAMEVTKKYDKMHLTILLAYNGTTEMIDAIRKIVSKVTPKSKITKEMIKENLYTKDLPPVDLLIRTGNHTHLSAGFMMWDIADSHVYFSEKLWPEFDNKELDKAITDYQKRDRKFGI